MYLCCALEISFSLGDAAEKCFINVVLFDNIITMLAMILASE